MTLDLGSIQRLHAVKNSAYGNAWKRRGELLGIFTNLARKVDRLEHLARHEVEVNDESRHDTLVDLLVYGLKYQSYLLDEAPALRPALLPSAGSGDRISDDPKWFDQLLQRWPQQYEPDQCPSSLTATLDSLQAAIEEHAPATRRLQLAQALTAWAWHALGGDQT